MTKRACPPPPAPCRYGTCRQTGRVRQHRSVRRLRSTPRTLSIAMTGPPPDVPGPICTMASRSVMKPPAAGSYFDHGSTASACPQAAPVVSNRVTAASIARSNPEIPASSMADILHFSGLLSCLPGQTGRDSARADSIPLLCSLRRTDAGRYTTAEQRYAARSHCVAPTPAIGRSSNFCLGLKKRVRN